MVEQTPDRWNGGYLLDRRTKSRSSRGKRHIAKGPPKPRCAVVECHAMVAHETALHRFRLPEFRPT